MRGSTVFRPVAATCWNLDARVEAMDRDGVAHHVLSPVPITMCAWGDPRMAATFHRNQNEAFAERVRESAKGRFSWIGAVPLQDSKRAVSNNSACAE
jgi:aminocarboxymuconate-semialdehyde decarboxylase